MARILWFKSEMFTYTIYGIAFGFMFPILATIIDLTKHEMDFSLEAIIAIQKKYPIHYIIDTAPLFLGFFASLAGRHLDELKEKNKEIIKGSKFKEDFLANMSHEIRTPMVGVIGMIDLLSKNTKLNSLQKEYVNTIHQSSLNLLAILNQILDLSKIEAGKFTLSPTHSNIKNLIRQNISLFSASAKAKNLNLVYNYDPKLPETIVVDEHRLTQIISNLIGNAIKFSFEGDIHVYCSLQSKVEKDLLLKIEVKDTGIGISKKDQETLFSRFSQFHDPASFNSKGSGLGLTICKKLVSLMQGTIGVESELEKGSNFWFTFKAKESTHTPSEKEELFQLSETQKYKLNVLLVEDSEISILVSKQILKYLGCTVEVAKDGLQAINIFEENTFDLILMDINLPELNGLQTCNLIRQKYKKVPPIIALTSNALPGDAELYTAKGMDDYITKPFTTEIMNIKLKKWFEESVQEY